MNQQDINTARSLLINPDSWPIRADSASGPETIKRLYAELVPREWSDIWAFQRRGLLRVIHRDERDGRRIDWAADFDVVAYVRGVEIDAVFVDL